MPGQRLLDQKVGQYTGDWILRFSPEFHSRNIGDYTWRQYVSNEDMQEYVESCMQTEGLSFHEWKKGHSEEFDLDNEENDDDLKNVHFFEQIVARAAIARRMELEREQERVNRNLFSFEDYHPPRGYQLQEVYAPASQQIEGTPLHVSGRRARPSRPVVDEGTVGPIRRPSRRLRGPVPEYPADL